MSFIFISNIQNLTIIDNKIITIIVILRFWFFTNINKHYILVSCINIYHKKINNIFDWVVYLFQFIYEFIMSW
ncbi:MAG: hypothetical protein CME37_05390 [Haliea sp.]|nr:hypothetical protein [Haliea sp.]